MKTLRPAFFRFERLKGGEYLLTNDSGRRAFLSPAEFGVFSAGGTRPGSALARRLGPSHFFRERLDINAAVGEIRSISADILAPPSLHILALTRRCNLACSYCRTPRRGTDMSRTTARRAVDMAFSSPARALTLEFQGGEPLLNWPVLKDAVEYALKKNKTAAKELELALVTNLVLLDDEKAEFLAAAGARVCTSLDGPADLHDANRRWLRSHDRRWRRPGGRAGGAGSSHAAVEAGLEKLKKLNRLRPPPARAPAPPLALMTATRLSLGREKDIIDEYRRLGLGEVFLRSFSPIGVAAGVRGELGCAPDEFGDFYEHALDYILALNRRGAWFVERNAVMLARKILCRRDSGYIDLRSPCGAATAQLAYGCGGDIYACDDGRMLGDCGDNFFRVGRLGAAPVGDTMPHGVPAAAASPAARLCAYSSCLESQPKCFRCAYKPYCGVCPVHNYATQSSPWGNLAAGGWCAAQKRVIAAVLERLARPANAKIISSWVGKEYAGCGRLEQVR